MCRQQYYTFYTSLLAVLYRVYVRVGRGVITRIKANINSTELGLLTSQLELSLAKSK